MTRPAAPAGRTAPGAKAALDALARCRDAPARGGGSCRGRRVGILEQPPYASRDFASAHERADRLGGRAWQCGREPRHFDERRREGTAQRRVVLAGEAIGTMLRGGGPAL